MAESVFKFDKAALVKYLESLRAKALERAGKPGWNPYLWINAHVKPLFARIEKGETTQELSNTVATLKLPEFPAEPKEGDKK